MHTLIALLALACGGSSEPALDEDGDGFPAELDCDDSDAHVFPGALEVCNELDDNCDGRVDEGAADAATWYLDADGDGLGDEAISRQACDQPAGWTADSEDCDDGSAASHPEGQELCDGLDNDCDGLVDDEAQDAQTFYADEDGDGYGLGLLSACAQPEGASLLDGDCDDSDPEQHPGATEVCNGEDDDCDGQVDFDATLPGTYSDVADPVANAPDGAHICVGSGTFQASELPLRRDITFEGEGPESTIFDAAGSYMFVDELWQGPNLGLIDLGLSGIDPEESHGGLYSGGWGADVLLRGVVVEGLRSSGSDSRGLLLDTEYGGTIQLEQVEVSDTRVEAGGDRIHGLLVFTGGELIVRDLSFTRAYVEGDAYGLLFYLQHGSADIAGVEISEVEVFADYEIEGLLLSGDTFAGLQVEGVRIQGLQLAFLGAYGSVNGLLASFVDYSAGGSSFERIELVDNAVRHDNRLYIRGSALQLWTGKARCTNWLVAGNRFEAAKGGRVYGGLEMGEYGSSTWTNVDFTNNSFTGFDYVYGGLFYDEKDRAFAVSNLNSSSNDFGEAYAYGSIWHSSEDLEGAAEVLWAYNNVHGNVFGGESSDFSADGEELEGLDYLSEDPGYVGGGDYHLAAGSALIDAGDPGIEDADGSVSDIGAYGGPGGDW